ncbi:hypothetical protein JKP88DRAFT_249348 [Tribonema minus]|uniref:Uncharacterized protein n=1 Tax=Tribonema minus TaxID=303371 RepID=A0A836C8N8_9STRA|nr:hypothetical protein JKP88DRAFT_249348 [Tribonema minus]
MAHYVWEALFRAGALHLVGSQQKRRGSTASTSHADIAAELDAQDAQLQAVQVRRVAAARELQQSPAVVEAAVDVKLALAALAEHCPKWAAAYSTCWGTLLLTQQQRYIDEQAAGNNAAAGTVKPVAEFRAHIQQRRGFNMNGTAADTAELERAHFRREVDARKAAQHMQCAKVDGEPRPMHQRIRWLVACAAHPVAEDVGAEHEMVNLVRQPHFKVVNKGRLRIVV